MNRLFISYRSSDGKREADRLCADLSRLYGEDQVFFDKQDLRGGLSWRSAIEATLGSRPVVLLVMTPELLGGSSAGGRRIDREDDPIRTELLAAHQSGAVVVPLLTEGMVMPAPSTLPAALRFVCESHALKLRTDDWANDLARLVVDLQAHGLTLRAHTEISAAAAASPAPRARRWPLFTAIAVSLVLALAALVPDDTEDLGAAGGATADSGSATAPSAATPDTADLSGPWWSVDAQQRRVAVHLAQQGHSVELRSEPIPVAWYPEWLDYAQQLQRSQGVAVHELVYLAKGERAAQQLDLRFEVFSSAGHGPLDTGNFTLQVQPGGREIHGQLWSNGDQAQLPVRLVRGP